jgi:hypothetical protein
MMPSRFDVATTLLNERSPGGHGETARIGHRTSNAAEAAPFPAIDQPEKSSGLRAL